MPRTIRGYLPWYPEWTIKAACANSGLTLQQIDEIFFQYGRNAKKIAKAKAICATCPVIRKCYRQNKEVPHGIFFGMTALERWRMNGHKGYPDSSAGYAFFAQFYGKRWNGIGGRGRNQN